MPGPNDDDRPPERPERSESAAATGPPNPQPPAAAPFRVLLTAGLIVAARPAIAIFVPS